MDNEVYLSMGRMYHFMTLLRDAVWARSLTDLETPDDFLNSVRAD
jgi:hypothetical protein